MVQNAGTFRGVVRGKVIELERAVNLPDGQEVTVIIQPSNGKKLLAGEGIRRSFGGWAEDADELDAYLEWNRQQRKQTRREPGQ